MKTYLAVKTSESTSEQLAIYLSLVQMITDEQPLQPSMEDKAVSFLEHIKQESSKDVDSFFLRIAPSSLQEPSNTFVLSVVALISVPSKRIKQATTAFVENIVDHASMNTIPILVNSNLIPQLFSSLDLFSPTFKEAAYTHSSLNKLLHKVYRRFNQHFHGTPQYHDPKDHQTLLETLHNNVVLPSDRYIQHLCEKRHSINDDVRSYFFVNFLLELLTIAPQHQPTLEFVLNLPICLTVTSVMTVFTFDDAICVHLYTLKCARKLYSDIHGELRERWMKVIRSLRVEGFEDFVEQRAFDGPHTWKSGIFPPTDLLALNSTI